MTALPSVAFSSTSNEHYTPPLIVEAARYTLGEIDLDPASGAKANTIVCASRFFSTEDNGFVQPWRGRVFLNPPGGYCNPVTGLPAKRGASSAAAWWSKLACEYEDGNVEAAIFVGFNLEILRTTQKTVIGRAMLDFPLCFPSERIDYLAEHPDGELRPQGDPPRPSVIGFLPPRPIAGDSTSALAAAFRFVEAFSPIGRCIIGGGRWA